MITEADAYSLRVNWQNLAFLLNTLTGEKKPGHFY